MDSNPIIVNKTDLKLYLYLFIAFIFLITVGISAIKGDIDFEFYADSETYIEFMAEKNSISEILLFNQNMLGPTVVLTALNESYIAVFLFNIFIVLYFYFTLTNNYKINKRYLFFFIVISPMFFSSVILINKEIISLLSIALFFKYYKNNSFSMLILSILISLLVRWQMTLFIICLTVMLSRWNPLKNYKLVMIVLFLLSISIVYYLNLASFERFNRVAELGAESADEGSGLFNTVLGIQNSNIFGYFIAFIPKFLFLFIGVLARYYKFFDFTEFYNNVIVFLQSVAHLIILYSIVKFKVKIDNIFLLAGFVYSIIFALSPIFAPRYFFPAYVLFALAVASNIGAPSKMLPAKTNEIQ